MKPERGPRVQLDFAQRMVRIEHVYHAQLIEVQPHLRVQRRL